MRGMSTAHGCERLRRGRACPLEGLPGVPARGRAARAGPRRARRSRARRRPTGRSGCAPGRSAWTARDGTASGEAPRAPRRLAVPALDRLVPGPAPSLGGDETQGSVGQLRSTLQPPARERGEPRRALMPYDLVIKNGMVVDGSGFSRYRADVAVKDGTIVQIGKIRGAASATIDADGLFVAPGIIDTHTHYDAQPLWDKLCTPSIWHGGTTVLMGNCGLTLAPLRPEHRDTMLATFCCVEDLPVRSLASVLPWNWETFGEYLDAIDHGLGLNLMPLVGHNPLRLSAMDQAAWDRAATPAESAHMQGRLHERLEPGPWGWSAP